MFSLPILALFLSLTLAASGAPSAQASSAPPPGASAAASISPEDARQAQQIVRAQLAAFASDDADQAFSYASASIRQMFGTAAQFMHMVRGSYPVVYRPAAVVFLKPEKADDELVQPVHMTDQSGLSWLALYRLQRQGDKTWRIGGCVLVPRAGKSV